MKRTLALLVIVAAALSCDTSAWNAVPRQDGQGGPVIFHTVVDSTRGIECWATGTYGYGGGSISCLQVR